LGKGFFVFNLFSKGLTYLLDLEHLDLISCEAAGDDHIIIVECRSILIEVSLLDEVGLDSLKLTIIPLQGLIELAWQLDLSERSALSTQGIVGENQELLLLLVVCQSNWASEHGIVSTGLSLLAHGEPCSILTLDIDASLLHNSLVDQTVIQLLTLILSFVLLLVIFHQGKLPLVSTDGVSALHSVNDIHEPLLGGQDLCHLVLRDVSFQDLLGKDLVLTVLLT
jgi:hypothetical protein